MKTPLAATLVLGALVAPALADPMTIFPNGSRPSAKGPEAYFTGPVRVDMQFASPGSRVTVGHVTFEPGSRSAWHTHPAGQILIVTSGTGWIQEEGGQRREIKPGDVIWTPPGVKHWHGATATVAMTHTSIAETVDGKNVDWLEKVRDEDYAR